MKKYSHRIVEIDYAEDPRPKNPRVDSIKVMTYNMGYASGMKNNLGCVLTKEEIIQNLEAVCSAIEREKPDIIALQEVDFFSARSHFINQRDYLQERLHYPYQTYAENWYCPYVPWPYWPPKRHFGRVISGWVTLSRFPLISNKALIFDKPHTNPFYYNWFYLHRGALMSEVFVNDDVLNIWNLHLEAYCAPTRSLQGKAMDEIISKENSKKYILMGDFNADVSEFKFNLVSTNSKNLSTFPSDGPQQCLDHILVSPSIQVLETKTIATKGSDHLPLISKLSL